MIAVGEQTQKERHPLARKRVIVLVTSGSLLLIAAILSLMIGPVSFSMQEIWNGIFVANDTMERRIVWELRFPRVLVGMIVGVSLAVAGAILQGVMRNPL